MSDLQHVHLKAVQKPRPLRRPSSRSDSEGETPVVISPGVTDPVVVNPRPVHLKTAQKPRPLKIQIPRNETTAAPTSQGNLTNGQSARTNGTPATDVAEKTTYGPKSQRLRLIDKSNDVGTTMSAAQGILNDERLGDCMASVAPPPKRETQAYFPVHKDPKKDTEAGSPDRHNKETRESKEWSPRKAEALSPKYSHPLNMDKVKISRDWDSRSSASIARLSIPKAEGAAVENRKVTGFVAMVTSTDIVRVNDENVTFDIVGTEEQQNRAIKLILERCYDTDLAPQGKPLKSFKIARQTSNPDPRPPPPTTVQRQASVPNLQTKDQVAAEKTLLVTVGKETGRRKTRWCAEKPELIPSVENQVKAENVSLQKEIEVLEKQLQSRPRGARRQHVEQYLTADFSAYIDSVKDMVEKSLHDQPEPHMATTKPLEAIPELDLFPAAHRFAGGDMGESASSRVTPPAMASPRSVTSPIPMVNGTSATSPSHLPGSRLSPRFSNLLGRMKIRGRDMVARGSQSSSSPVSPELLPLGDSDSSDSEKDIPVKSQEKARVIRSVTLTGNYNERRKKILVLARCPLARQKPVGWDEMIIDQNICSVFIKPKQMFDPEPILHNIPSPNFVSKQREERDWMRDRFDHHRPIDEIGLLDDLF